jgi:hypothetical protein
MGTCWMIGHQHHTSDDRGWFSSPRWCIFFSFVFSYSSILFTNDFFLDNYDAHKQNIIRVTLDYDDDDERATTITTTTIEVAGEGGNGSQVSNFFFLSYSINVLIK